MTTMHHHSAEIIHSAKQLVGSKWCLLVVRKKVIPINSYSSEIIIGKRCTAGGGGEKNLCQGRPHSKHKTGSKGGSLDNWQ